MQFTATASSITTQASACLVVGCYQEQPLNSAAQTVDRASNGVIAQLIKQGDMTGKLGQTCLIHAPEGIRAERLLIIGLGKQTTLSEKDFNSLCQKLATALTNYRVKNAHLALADISVTDRDQAWQARQLAQSLQHNSYSFEQLKSKKTEPSSLKKISVDAGDKKQLKAVKAGLVTGAAIAEGMALARDLGNLPGNVCTPSYLATQAKKMARGQSNLSCKVLDEKHMRELKMGSLLSVSAGSDEQAKLIVLEYKGAAKSQKPYVLVGKGITFDTGGISLKPGSGMDEMKYDMCGAASVFGTLQTLLSLAPKINVTAIIAASENMPSGRATKPGDIVTSMSGQTIEVLNTDAEGRLVLCDALTYAERFKPQTVIDIATLTGACVVALGKHASGLYSNSEQLAQELLDAGQNSGDKAWHMPLWDEYQQQLDSNFADIANIGGPQAGSVTAACFLSRFTKKYQWAHLDIAGTAWLSGASKGATGRPVPLLTEYLLSKAR